MPNAAVLSPPPARGSVRESALGADAPPLAEPSPIPPLRDGDRMDADEFLRRYWAMPEDFRAELIAGKVTVPMPVRRHLHGQPVLTLSTCIGVYAAATPGTDGAVDSTTRLSDDDVPQPDLMLRVSPECGGQTRDTPDDLIAGAPELVAEVSASSVRTDMGAKRAAYLAAGVREYLVWRTERGELDWFVRRGAGPAARFEPLPAGDGGMLRSEAFPGLWLDRPALLRRDLPAVLAALQTGLDSPAHAAFAATLAAAPG